MEPEQAALAAELLQADRLVPIHYGAYDLPGVYEPVSDPLGAAGRRQRPRHRRCSSARRSTCDRRPAAGRLSEQGRGLAAAMGGHARRAVNGTGSRASPPMSFGLQRDQGQRPTNVTTSPTPAGVSAQERLALAFLLGLGGLVALLLVVFAGGYGYHRDELYFLAAGRHLAWGYPDQGPVTPLVAHLMSLLAPGSLAVLRIPPALTSAGTVVLTGAIAYELGARRRARADRRQLRRGRISGAGRRPSAQHLAPLTCSPGRS